MPQMRSVSWPLLETMMTGMARVAGSFASVRVARNPSTPGITMSMRMRSGRISRALRMPSAPSAAPSVSKPWFSSMRRIWKTSVGESSTIRMRAMAVLPSFAADVPLDRGQELVARERLREVMLGADDASAGAVEEPVLRGQHDHRDRAEHLVVLDQRAGLVAVEPRHHDVHEHDVRLVVGDLRQRVETVDGRENLAAFLGQQRLRRAADRLAVVDDEHFQPVQAVPISDGCCTGQPFPPGATTFEHIGPPPATPEGRPRGRSGPMTGVL